MDSRPLEQLLTRSPKPKKENPKTARLPNHNKSAKTLFLFLSKFSLSSSSSLVQRMPPKRPSPLEQNPPSPSSSSDTEEDVEGSSEEEEEEEVKPSQPSLKNPKSKQNPDTRNSVPKPQSSDDEEVEDSDAEKAESESESDSDSDNEPVNHMIAPRNATEVKPISSKPMSEPSKSKKPTTAIPKPTTSAQPAKVSDAPKRPLEEDKKEKRERKKTKKFAELEEEDKKSGKDKKPFERVWSDEDEIVLLNGLIDFKKKGNSVTNVNAFLDFIKGSVHVVEFNKTKLNSKIQRLKQKYQNNANRAKPGEDPVISRPHELKSYQLSKQIWGDKDDGLEANNVGSESVKTDVKKSKTKVNSNGTTPKVPTLSSNVEQKEEVNGSGSEYLYLKQSTLVPNFPTPVVPPWLGEIFEKKGWDSAKNLNAEELDHKWKDVLIAESKAYSARLNLVKEQTKLMLDEVESSNH